jgi:flagellar motor switch protein FliN/FliY
MTLVDADNARLDSATEAAARVIAEALGLEVELGETHDGSAPGALLVPGAGSQAAAAALIAAADPSQINGWLVLALSVEVLNSIQPDETGRTPSLVEVVQVAMQSGAAAFEPTLGPQYLDQPESVDAGTVLRATVAERGPQQLLSIVPLMAGDRHIGTVAVAVDQTVPSPLELPSLGPSHNAMLPARPMSTLNDVEMGVTVELGRTRLAVRDLLELHPGAVVQLDRSATSPVDIFVNGTLVARGEVVVVDDDFGVRITDLIERL